jgi:hypothetical protein
MSNWRQQSSSNWRNKQSDKVSEETFSSLINKHNFDLITRLFEEKQVVFSPLSSFFVLSMV